MKYSEIRLHAEALWDLYEEARAGLNRADAERSCALELYQEDPVEGRELLVEHTRAVEAAYAKVKTAYAEYSYWQKRFPRILAA